MTRSVFTEEWLAERLAKQGKPFPQVKSAPEFSAEVKVEKPSRVSSTSGPNKTEAAYGRVLTMEFPGARIRYEALTLQLDNGHAYRPDWVVTLASGEILCVEVKNGAYKHASYGRSRMAYHQAQIDWPMLRFRWAELYQGTWKTE